MERPIRSAHSAATRYLCVGGELDEAFARRVIGELIDEQFRVVAPSYGVDVVPVAQHCLKAQRRRAIRDAALTALLLGELVLAPLPAAVAILLAAWARWAFRLAPRGIGGVAVVLAVVAFAVATVAWFQYGDELLATPAGPALRVSGLERVGAFLISLPAIAVLAGLINFIEWHTARMLVGAQLRADSFEPNAMAATLSPRVRRRLEVIRREQYRQVTVYHSSAEFPFVGAGQVLRDSMWSFALDLHRKADALLGGPQEISPFEPMDLYTHVEHRLLALRDPGLGQAYCLPDLAISDEVFVSGLTGWDSMPAPVRLARVPITREEIVAITNVPVGLFRHFKCLRVESWGGELVISVFLHFATQGRTLYVEFTPCLLPPILPEYHLVDAWPFPTWEERWQAAGDALGRGVSMLLTAPGRLIGSQRLAADAGRRARDIQRRASRGQIFDLGARVSVRELGATPEPDHYFQWLDARKYLRTLEVQILNGITEFLESRGIDTSELHARQATILNTGTFMPGATIQGQAIAIGKAPTASVWGARPAAASSAGTASGGKTA